MPRLDYEPAGPRLPWMVTGVPVAAFGIVAAMILHRANEPFSEFAVSDVAVQVGGPLLLLGLWLAWVSLALRGRHAVPPLLFVLAAVWAAFSMWIGADLCHGYFNEPWNR